MQKVHSVSACSFITDLRVGNLSYLKSQNFQIFKYIVFPFYVLILRTKGETIQGRKVIKEIRYIKHILPYFCFGSYQDLLDAIECSEGKDERARRVPKVLQPQLWYESC